NLALEATASTSYVSPWETLDAVNDGSMPSHSNDKSNGAYGNWNNPNSIQWVQYAWSSEMMLVSTDIYWFDDGGGVLTPTTAYVEYWDGANWVNAGNLPTVKDTWNTIELDSIVTTKFRVSMLNPSQSTGILEWRVYGGTPDTGGGDPGNGSGGDAFTWPQYSPNISYDFKDEFPSLPTPTKVLDDCPQVVGTQSSGWWTFRWGPNANSLVTSNAITPLLERMNKDFAYFRDEMGWPPDLRAKKGYKSAIYLYGSGLCTDNASNTDLGGWQSTIFHNGVSWPMVLASYYPIYSFDPACTFNDRESQQGAMVHEGIHAVLADLPGVKKSAWFHEGGNVWLQQTADARRSGDFSSMGFLNGTDFIAPFMPIECYTGWLQDGSFGGPSAEGVNMFDGEQQICTWRTYLGGHQYSSSFPTFLGNTLGDGSVPWIWRHCPDRVLEGIAGGLGEAQTRRLISEYRAKQALVDFGPWTSAVVALIDANFQRNITAEWQPSWLNPDPWTATPYVKTSNDGNGLLTPEARTTPGWSGGNQIPLTVSGNMVTVNFQPIGRNMTCQLAYRATDGTPVYSELVSSGELSLRLDKAPANGVVIAVIANTDYIYEGESTRKAHFDYRLQLVSGVSGTADIYTKWYQSANLAKASARTTGAELGMDMSKYCSHDYRNKLPAQEVKNIAENGILMYPNPAASGDEIQMQFNNPNAESIAVSVVNASGQVVYEGHTQDNNLVIVPGKQWGAGMYVVTIKSSGTEHQRKLVIVDKK
ncbi:T9SS type A sorting domain-containing protein, partial [Fulvivirga kasyanovii]